MTEGLGREGSFRYGGQGRPSDKVTAEQRLGWREGANT